jgi:DNA-directed RNA polymerase specialized sigma24 family protein
MNEAVDYNHVPAHQEAIHDRLVNWAKWCRSSGGRTVHPMFRGYRDNYWEAQPLPDYVSTIDATEVQKTMAHLPEKHRLAVQWCYVIKSSPPRMARELGTSKYGLLELINEGRTMISNRLRVTEAA